MYYNSLEGIVTFEAFRIARTPPINNPKPYISYQTKYSDQNNLSLIRPDNWANGIKLNPTEFKVLNDYAINLTFTTQ